MTLIGKELATNTMLDKVMCVCSGRRPVKTYTEGLAYKGLSCTLVTAKAGINFSQELLPFFFGDAPLKHSGRAFLIEFPFMDFVSFRTSDNAACFVLVFRELLPI